MNIIKTHDDISHLKEYQDGRNRVERCDLNVAIDQESDAELMVAISALTESLINDGTMTLRESGDTMFDWRDDTCVWIRWHREKL